MLTNLGLLGFFKYFNFFIENISEAFSFFGQPIELGRLDIILPVGISFYTFQTMSYTIDVYRKQLKASNDFIAFSAFVSFFPQLVAGPIERATHLLPQFLKKRSFNYSLAIDGMRQMLWGFFKKIVIADNCSQYANEIFNNYQDQNGATLLVGALCFTFQIYGDFSGYSDIAIGTARLFGFDLKQNFNFPYFSRDIAEFWRRWHISLSTWFRDYLYIPLGGSQGGVFYKVRNTFIIFLVSGFWHGANWTFIIWGLLNAIYFLPLLLTNRNRRHVGDIAKDKFFPDVKSILGMIGTFILTVFAWIFFRSETVTQAFSIIRTIISPSILNVPELSKLSDFYLLSFAILFFLFIEWQGRHCKFALEHLGLKWRRVWRVSFYYVLIFAIFWFYGQEKEFIYFQF
jgi:alginate O-acetyltransferase complex protein AlgI